MLRSDTTAAVQHYLDELQGHRAEESAAPIVRDLLAEAADRLQLLCGSMLHRSYARLSRPPLQLHADEMLSAVVERLMKALRDARPGNVRQFFALANLHMRWELNDLARRLDDRTPAVEIREEPVVAQGTSETGSGANTRRILEAIERLPEPEREVFSLIRIQGLSHPEAAGVLKVSAKTIQRRLNRGLLLLSAALSDLRKDQSESVEV
jgi:RNA polymerase sigma factor (sigma-70 family)